MWQGPFNDFPREVGFPQRAGVVYNLKEFVDKINRNNGKTNIYTSLYAFDKINSNGKPDYDSARITHIFLDLDNGACFENVKKLHQYLIEQQLIHTMFFSGAGFHVYVGTKYPNFLQNKKAAIFNAVVDICDKLGLKIGINEHSDIDAHAIGNLAQLVRVPNTWNIKRKRFCISIYALDLIADFDYILHESQKQRNPIFKTIYGSKYLDLTPYDKEKTERVDLPEFKLEEKSGIEVDVDKFLPCIKSLLNRKVLKHRERFLIILYCKELGLPMQDSISLLQKYLSPRIFYHSIKEEHQPLFIYKRADLLFPSCNKLKEEGYCIDGCKGK